MKKTLLVALMVFMSGCAIQQFEIKPSRSQSPNADESQTFWVGGIGQSQEVDAAKVCGEGKKVSKVETQQTAGNVGLMIITLGIYSPRQIRVYCTQ
ncbi:MAG: hypothetical protein RL307_733 [Pseudomonadota bacterium]